jgi:predicted phage terminase large subunit-like protein
MPTQINEETGQEEPVPLEYYMGVDPAFTEKTRNDETAMTVIGVHGKMKYVVAFLHMRTKSNKKLMARAIHLAETYHPYRIGYESVQGQAMLAHALREELGERKDLAVTVYDVPTSRDKDARMALLADEVEAGRLLLRGDGDNRPHKSQEVLYSQMIQYPHGDHDDGPDSLDFACQQVPRGSVDNIGDYW